MCSTCGFRGGSGGDLSGAGSAGASDGAPAARPVAAPKHANVPAAGASAYHLSRGDPSLPPLDWNLAMMRQGAQLNADCRGSSRCRSV